MKERTQIALLSAALGLSIGVGFSLWLEASTDLPLFLFPAALGALTALIIAFVAYPWQKGLDREADFRLEQRQELRSFLLGWLEIELELERLRTQSRTMNDFHSFAEQLVAFGPDKRLLSDRLLLTCEADDTLVCGRLDERFDQLLRELGNYFGDLLKSSDANTFDPEPIRADIRSILLQWRNDHQELSFGLINTLRDREPYLENKVDISRRQKRDC